MRKFFPRAPCIRCCLTSTTRLSRSSLSVFLQDRKSPLSSLVCKCVSVFESLCNRGRLRVCLHAQGEDWLHAQWKLDNVFGRRTWQFRGLDSSWWEDNSVILCSVITVGVFFVLLISVLTRTLMHL